MSFFAILFLRIFFGFFILRVFFFWEVLVSFSERGHAQGPMTFSREPPSCRSYRLAQLVPHHRP
jgi:hypothetical protein